MLEIGLKANRSRTAENEDFLFQVVKAAVGRRRKTVKNSLVGSELKISSEIALRALDRAKIDPSRRAETLEVDEFVSLSDSLAAVMET